MSLEYVANADLTLAHSAGSLISGGTFTIISVASSNVKADSGVYVTPLSFSFAGGNATGFTPGTVAGAAAIQATATKTKADGLAVIRQGDKVTMIASGTQPGPPPVVVTITGDVEISDAGQTKVKAQ